MPILKEGTISIGKIKDGLVFKNEFRFRKSHLSEETTGMVPTCEERRETMIERTIQYEGYEGQVEIQPLGWRTGYVFIPKEHPLYGCLEEKAERIIICHGGVTFVGMRKDEGGKERFAIGFDCAHYGDTSDRWTTDAVEDELRSMIVQLAEIANEKAR